MRADISCAGHVLRTRPTSMSSPWNRAPREVPSRIHVQKTLSDLKMGMNGSEQPGGRALGDVRPRRRVSVDSPRRAALRPLHGQLVALQGRRKRPAAAACVGGPLLGIGARHAGSSSAGRGAAGPWERVASSDVCGGRDDQDQAAAVRSLQGGMGPRRTGLATGSKPPEAGPMGQASWRLAEGRRVAVVSLRPHRDRARRVRVRARRCAVCVAVGQSVGAA